MEFVKEGDDLRMMQWVGFVLVCLMTILYVGMGVKIFIYFGREIPRPLDGMNSLRLIGVYIIFCFVVVSALLGSISIIGYFDLKIPPVMAPVPLLSGLIVSVAILKEDIKYVARK